MFKPKRSSTMAALAAGFCLALFDQASAQSSVQGSDVTPLAAARPLAQILPDDLAGRKATTPLEEYGTEDLEKLAGDKQGAYREYKVVGAAARAYGAARVEVFRTETPFGAFGLLSYTAGTTREASVWVSGQLTFRRSNFFIRVSGKGSVPPSKATISKLAEEVGARIAPESANNVSPALIDSVPRDFLEPMELRYFLGPQSLRAFVGPSADAFDFAGNAEAVVADYRQAAPASDPLRLLIVEYHTPQFALESMERLNTFMASMPAEEREHYLSRRVGNYIVQVTNVGDAELAGRLIDSVRYPYGVKWLRNPDIPNGDPFYAQKTAEVLLSTFGIIGLVMAAGAVIGSAFGTLIFIKRRKRLRAIFSDAGGMLRLDIEPLPGTSLGPAQSRTLIGNGEE